MVVVGADVEITSNGNGVLNVEIHIQAEAVTVEAIRKALQGIYGDRGSVDMLFPDDEVEKAIAAGQPYYAGTLPPQQ